ncbi:ABC transporter permease [Corynebacterium sp. ACRPH]|uniref:ABC transporter permease n=1 Tax=Corynebacterium sp. ACRPH TaxID=2918199 RepID=UPI001EF37C95|nr:ABC transporter permease [Corynebacterium sp. ACRPH]MCG7455996.1 ABC transporter permease [Corynebacterium sp. ACRPH]
MSTPTIDRTKQQTSGTKAGAPRQTEQPSVVTRFKRALRAELTQLKEGRTGHTIMALVAVASVAWSCFFTFLILKYGDGGQTVPSARMPVAGVFQVGVYGLLVWTCWQFLREESTRQSKLKALMMPTRALTWGAKLCWTMLTAVVAFLVTGVLSTVVTLAVTKLMGLEISEVIGAPVEYAALAAQTVLLAVGTVFFAAALSIAIRAMGYAIAVTLGWLMLFEGMIDGSDPAQRVMHSLLPFANGTRSYEQVDPSQFLWSPAFSVVYFLGVTAGLFILTLAYASRRSGAGARSKEATP